MRCAMWTTCDRSRDLDSIIVLTSGLLRFGVFVMLESKMLCLVTVAANVVTIATM